MGASPMPEGLNRPINQVSTTDSFRVADVVGDPSLKGNKRQAGPLLGEALNLAKSFLAALKADDKGLALQLEPEMMLAIRAAAEQVDRTSHLMHDACRSANTALEELDRAPGGVSNTFFSRIDEQVRDADEPRNEALARFADYDANETSNLREVHLESLGEFVRDTERALKSGT